MTDDRTKSRAGRRFVPLPDAIVERLSRHRDSQDAERQKAAQLWVDEGWVFADELGRRLNRARTGTTGRSCSRRPAFGTAACMTLGSAATVLLLQGVHERTIMSILGWSSTAMVSRYANVIAPIHRDVAGRLDGLLWSSSEAIS